MKRIKPSFTKDFIAEKLCLSVKEMYEIVINDCNNFLKTKKGLQYLLLKYPNLPPEVAILEYISDAIRANNYDPTY